MDKELEALEKLGNIDVVYNRNGIESCYSIKDTDEFEIIKTALEALEIIKDVDIPLLFIKRHTYEEYLESPFSKYEDCFLRKEKYDLVKEVLLCNIKSK